MKKMSVHNLTLAALFVAITAVLSQIVVPMPLVPFNLGVLALFLCGGMLPKGTAFLSLLCYIILGGSVSLSLPSLAGGPLSSLG